MKSKFSPQIFKKYSNIKFHKNPSSGSQAVPCAQTDRQTNTETVTKKPAVTFCNFANAPKKKSNHSQNRFIPILRGNSGLVLLSLTLTDMYHYTLAYRGVN